MNGQLIQSQHDGILAVLLDISLDKPRTGHELANFFDHGLGENYYWSKIFVENTPSQEWADNFIQCIINCFSRQSVLSMLARNVQKQREEKIKHKEYESYFV